MTALKKLFPEFAEIPDDKWVRVKSLPNLPVVQVLCECTKPPDRLIELLDEERKMYIIFLKRALFRVENWRRIEESLIWIGKCSNCGRIAWTSNNNLWEKWPDALQT